jgi:hypothetical protein
VNENSKKTDGVTLHLSTDWCSERLNMTTVEARRKQLAFWVQALCWCSLPNEQLACEGVQEERRSTECPKDKGTVNKGLSFPLKVGTVQFVPISVEALSVRYWTGNTTTTESWASPVDLSLSCALLARQNSSTYLSPSHKVLLTTNTHHVRGSCSHSTFFSGSHFKRSSQ